jgi:hypothetical protein
MSITKEQLESLYIEQGLTIRQCAKALGLPTSGSISRKLRKFEIQARPQLQTDKFHGGGKPPEKCSGWKGGKQVVQCDACGKELQRFPSLIHEKNFCNDSCYGKWRAENFKGTNNPNHGNSVLAGEANPNWKGGIACEPYAPIWGDKRFKASIRERDNHECQNPDCRGNSDILSIHHIDYDKKNCEPKNLITLCISCNARANFNREFWEAGYKEIICLKYQAYEQQYAI